MSVLCLISNPAEPELDVSLVATIQHEVKGEINWLNHGVCCEIIQPTAPDPLATARALIGRSPVDAVLVPLANRRKRLLVADMDSTMIDQECIDELADAVGIKGEVAAITERAMRGELDFAAALRTRVGLIKGLNRKVIEEIRRERITLAPGSRTLIQTMKTHGAVTSLVSGGFTFFAEWIGKRLGFDEWVANTLEFDGDVLHAGTIIWAAGVLASPAAKWLNAEADRAGRIKVEADLTVPGPPEIFAIGDTATVAGPAGKAVP